MCVGYNILTLTNVKAAPGIPLHSIISAMKILICSSSSGDSWEMEHLQQIKKTKKTPRYCVMIITKSIDCKWIALVDRFHINNKSCDLILAHMLILTEYPAGTRLEITLNQH